MEMTFDQLNISIFHKSLDLLISSILNNNNKIPPLLIATHSSTVMGLKIRDNLPFTQYLCLVLYTVSWGWHHCIALLPHMSILQAQVHRYTEIQFCQPHNIVLKEWSLLP